MHQPERSIVILLVEDSSDDVFFFRRAVTRSGLPATTLVAVDGLEAIDCLRREGRFGGAESPVPDVMFLDLKLPHINGFEVMEWLRRNADCARLPVVVLSSSNQPEDQQRAEQLGAASFLTKPPVAEQIRDVLHKCGLCAGGSVNGETERPNGSP